MVLPHEFQVLAAVVSDFHLCTPLEAACERYIQQRGARQGIDSRVWNWMVRSDKNVFFGRELLMRIRKATDTLVSLGDMWSHVVNEQGLAELRARVCALAVRRLLHAQEWKHIHYVPSDHDLGVRHRLTSVEERPLLQMLHRTFEETAEFQNELRRATEEHPDLAKLLKTLRPEMPADETAALSLEAYESICGPLWGQRPLADYTLVWASDVLIRVLGEECFQAAPAALQEAADAQRRFLLEVLAQKERVILCVHDPRVLPLLKKQLQDWHVRNIALTVAGHFHMPCLAWTLPRGIRRNFRLVVCPSLTGNRLAAGGGLFIGESRGELHVLRYSMEGDDVRLVF